MITIKSNRIAKKIKVVVLFSCIGCLHLMDKLLNKITESALIYRIEVRLFYKESSLILIFLKSKLFANMRKPCGLDVKTGKLSA